jgi:hypothetical protein
MSVVICPAVNSGVHVPIVLIVDEAVKAVPKVVVPGRVALMFDNIKL